MKRFIGLYRVASAVAVFVGAAVGWADANSVTLVSRTSDGKPLSAPVTAVAISRDGSIVAFASKAVNLGAEAKGAAGVYVYTRADGRLVAATSPSLGPDVKGLALDPDGRHIAIVTASGEVFLYDRAAKTTTPIALNEPGPMGPCSGEIAVSADARFVAMTAPSTSQDPPGRTQVWLLDRSSSSVSAISLAESGAPGGASSVVAGITPDGRYVLFLSDAKDLHGAPGNGLRQAYRYDRERRSIEMVSLGADGKPARKDCNAAAISDDGSVVAFVSADDALVSGDSNKAPDVFVRDLRSKKTERFTTMPEGVEPNSVAISGDGNRVFFLSSSSALPGTGGARAANVFCYSRADKTTRCVSATPAGVRAGGKCASPVTDATGKVCAFLSGARNLGAGGVAGVFAAELSPTVDVGKPVVGDKELRQRLDLNGDGKLDQLDVDALVKQIGKGDLRYDLNGDGAVDLRDLNLLLQNLDSQT
ncbi:MAG: hypothetical protein HRF45_02030 [Fimbriimonadia bacterium]|jgi:dipeptidyl aminopeptidase/acylaminoacyl peptidase